MKADLLKKESKLKELQLDIDAKLAKVEEKQQAIENECWSKAEVHYETKEKLDVQID